MNLPAREDYLEAVLSGTLALERSPTAVEIGTLLKDLAPIPEGDLTFLAQNGDIVINPDGTVELTTKGRVVAERVLKKHRVLQCFFHEMLGMDDQVASNEACVLEHSVSDSTIERITGLCDNRAHLWSSSERDGTRYPGRPCRYARSLKRYDLGTALYLRDHQYPVRALYFNNCGAL